MVALESRVGCLGFMFFVVWFVDLLICGFAAWVCGFVVLVLVWFWVCFGFGFVLVLFCFGFGLVLFWVCFFYPLGMIVRVGSGCICVVA